MKVNSWNYKNLSFSCGIWKDGIFFSLIGVHRVRGENASLQFVWKAHRSFYLFVNQGTISPDRNFFFHIKGIDFVWSELFFHIIRIFSSDVRICDCSVVNANGRSLWFVVLEHDIRSVWNHGRHWAKSLKTAENIYSSPLFKFQSLDYMSIYHIVIYLCFRFWLYGCWISGKNRLQGSRYIWVPI